MEVACDNIDCYWNGGKFCKKKVIFMRSGICGALVDRRGNKVPTQFWTDPIFDPDEHTSSKQADQPQDLK